MKTSSLVLLMLAVSSVAYADKSVRGYMRSNGTYVQPYQRTDKNQLKYDNYSSKGNKNPYTGKPGDKPNEFTNPPEYNKFKKFPDQK